MFKKFSALFFVSIFALSGFSAFGALPESEGPGTFPFIIEKADWPIHVAGPTVLIKPAKAESADEDHGTYVIKLAEGPGTFPFIIEKADWPIHVAGPTVLIKPACVEKGGEESVCISLANLFSALNDEGPGHQGWYIKQVADIRPSGPLAEVYWLIKQAQDWPVHVAGPTVLIKPAKAESADEDHGTYVIKLAEGPGQLPWRVDHGTRL